jgi:hypothetical protein
MKRKLLLILVCISIGFQLKGQILHIYGGKNHDAYLGCLNCNKFESTSIWNIYGTYGSKYNANSIWNKYGDYGSSYSNKSPFSKMANNPPIIVDKSGNFYGYFTINQYQNKRASFDLVNVIYKHHDDIGNDVSKWYEFIFD